MKGTPSSRKKDDSPSDSSRPESPPSRRDNESLSHSLDLMGTPSKSALRAFKGMSISTAPLEVVPGRRPAPFPGAIFTTEDKKKAKITQQRVWFAVVSAAIVFLLVLIIVSLEKLHNEDEMMNAAYPKRLEDFGFRASQLRATVKQLFLDGSLNLTSLLQNGTNFEPSSVKSVIDSSLERCSHQWLEKELKTPCHGMKEHSAYPELAVIETITSAQVCKALCCELGQKCGSWQYLVRSLPRPHTDVRICYLGGYVNNLLSTPSSNAVQDVSGNGVVWCDAVPTPKWRGKRLRYRQLTNKSEEVVHTRSTFSKDFTCEWGDDLPTQCYGLGDERTIKFYRNATDAVGSFERLSRKQCAGLFCLCLSKAEISQETSL